MHSRHKYFRNRRFQIHAKNRYQGNPYFCGIAYYSKKIPEGDEIYSSRHRTGVARIFTLPIDKSSWKAVRISDGRHFHHTKRFYKRYTNKKLRQSNKAFQNGEYKGIFDYWYTLY